MTMGRFHQNSAGDGLPVQPAFEAELPLDGVIFHVPHDSTDIPADVRNQFTLDDQELKSEILNMTDHFSARLFCSDTRAWAEEGADILCGTCEASLICVTGQN